MPTPHYPKGSRYSALEKNILKYRAFEMVLILFRIQELRGFVIESIRSTDRFEAASRGTSPRLPKGTRRPDREAWKILVSEGIISPEEAKELRSLVDYRNLVAHETERLTVDLHRRWSFRLRDLPVYRPKALERLETLAEKIEEGMASRFILPLSFDRILFDHAEKTYREEMSRLKVRIRKQMSAMKEEIDEVNAAIKSLPRGLLDRLEPGHPRQFSPNGTLSDEGIQCCYSLFRAGAGPLTVAYLMRISLRASKRWHKRWLHQTSDQK